MCNIKISGRKLWAKCDPQDYEYLNQFTWCVNNYGYCNGCVDGQIVYMHRLITGAGEGEQVDHINNDPLDNRRENLRIVSRSVNGQRKRYMPGASGYRGVHRRANKKKPDTFHARIVIDTQQHYLGTFATAEHAARAYDNAARKHFGQHCYVNFPTGSTPNAKTA